MIKTLKRQKELWLSMQTHETMEFYAKIVFVNANIGFYFPPFEFYIRSASKEWVMPADN
jgi:hypothetical protein